MSSCEKIHKLVKEKFDQGYKIVIVGDKNHPEVVGTNGWCGNTAMIVEEAEEVGQAFQGTEESEQWAVGSGQRTGESGQWAVGSRQQAGENGQWAIEEKQGKMI